MVLTNKYASPTVPCFACFAFTVIYLRNETSLYGISSGSFGQLTVLYFGFPWIYSAASHEPPVFSSTSTQPWQLLTNICNLTSRCMVINSSFWLPAEKVSYDAKSTAAVHVKTQSRPLHASSGSSHLQDQITVVKET